MPAIYENHSLFSDYYLEELVTGDAHWQALKKKAWQYRQRMANILEKAVPGTNGDTPEAEVERRLIRPILDSLEHVYFVQPAVLSPEGVRRPDYAFFPSPEAKQKAESHKGQLEFFKTALAVGDAKAWERSLDKRVKGAGDPFTNHNPSYQIDFYLRATDRRWGLLTNGRYWRLYHRDLSYRLDVYYEVDLLHILTLDDDAFLYFLAFFHKEAFQPDGTGECFLDRAYKASTEYAAKVSEELKENVYEALRRLAEGFLAFPGNNLKPQDLDLIRENAFIAIYRLLFILYAEAREFLPVANPTYWGTYSLRALTREIATKEPLEANLHPTATGYWSRLQGLFKLINSGDDFLRIPPYNGRLFDDEKEHQNLATWKIGDRYLAATIDQLARVRAGRTGRGFLSYRDLSIRELGSIYEGLLEHQPRYATQDVAVVKEDKRERFVPLAELGNRKALKTCRAGSVYLETDKGERKSTGSYYTPQYVVEYIVRNTLEPLLEEAKKSNGNVIEAILSLKVLDPAMGSGHFLVEATDFLARALVEALGGDPREMEEDEVRWARREVVERCIYGVDLNPLAVDLAKLSLWLSTVSLDKPLNFLDHHLRCGNSLIGARLEDIGLLPDIGKKSKATAVTTLAGHQFKSAIASAVSTFHRITEEPSDSVEDIHRKEGAYETARYALSRIKDIADVWTSAYFDNEVKDKDAYEQLLALAEQDSADWPKPGKVAWLDKARAIAQERHFFHWELEFPEIFFDQNGQRLQNYGFSGVVGNPPYINAIELVRTLSPYEKPFWKTRFSSAAGAYDIYLLFFELGLSLVAVGRMTALITPNKFLSAPYAIAFRNMIASQHELVSLCDCSRVRVFEDPFVYPVVSVFRRQSGKPGDYVVRIATAESSENMLGKVALHESTRLVILPDLLWGFLLSSNFDLLVKVVALSQPLSEVATVQATSTAAESDEFSGAIGSTLGRHKQRFINTGLIDRYCSLWGTEPLDHRGARYLEPYLDTGSPVVSESRRHLYSQPKVIFAKMALRLEGFADFGGEYASANTNCTYGGKYRLGYLCAILDSALLSLIYSEYFGALRMGGGYFQFQAPQLEVLPIRRINFTTPEAERQQLVEQSKSLYEEYLQTKDLSSVVSFATQLLPQKQDGTPDMERERSDVVHDLLALLAEQMTRLHKEKQLEIKGLLTWLESYLGVNIEDLKNKTKIKEYWKGNVEWEGFLGALEHNRRAIQSAKGVDVTRREPQETIRAEFQASVAKLRPLLERIDLTDKLIDQIVYKLYGLTPEEIAVVEGKQ
jgi:hypothetical protein